MYDEDIVEPIPCPDAFREGGDAARYSQAALLLALGIAMRREYALLLASLYDSLPFSLPELPLVDQPVSESRFDGVVADVARLAMEVPARRVQLMAAEDLYGNHGESRTADSALRLLAASLRDPDQLVRVAAAVSTLDLVETPTAALKVLVNAALRRPSNAVAGIATSALARVERDPQRWPRLARQLVRVVRSRSPLRWHSRNSIVSRQTAPIDNSACLVHGTLFVPVGRRPEEWWKPGTGDFHTYLKTGPRPNIYSGADYFSWSGGWFDDARSEGVEKLSRWVRDRRYSELDIFAHSHGANIAMLATHHVKIRQLVLLSCPVHWTLYQPKFSNVSDIVSLRIRWDLTIMADRGDQRFSDPRIREHVLPVWFGRHDSSRRSSTWRNRNLVQYLDSPALAKETDMPAPQSPRPAIPKFEYQVRVKGPREVAYAFVEALRAQPLIRSAHIPLAEFKNSPPRASYAIDLVAGEALTDAWVRDVALQVNAEVLSFARYETRSSASRS